MNKTCYYDVYVETNYFIIKEILDSLSNIKINKRKNLYLMKENKINFVIINQKENMSLKKAKYLLIENIEDRIINDPFN